MGFLSFLLLLAIVWLLWTISRNSTDALDKQTAMQHQLVAMEKRIETLAEQLAADKKAKPATATRRKSGTGSKSGAKATATVKKADTNSE